MAKLLYELTKSNYPLRIYEDQPYLEFFGGGSTATKVYYNTMQSVSFTEVYNFMTPGKIVISIPGTQTHPITFKSKEEDVARKIAEYIEQQIHKVKTQGSGGTVVNQASNMDELLKLKQLLDAGIVTQAEFDAKKKQLLG